MVVVVSGAAVIVVKTPRISARSSAKFMGFYNNNNRANATLSGYRHRVEKSKQKN